uniref:Expansin-like EG45 domain-containing protein n=1 Tax=Aegilops tauschii subsp. strangulata TaxID=200361 RepID=A0A453CG69_AEGTS
MKARVGSVSPVLFKGGEGCGACYKVRCLDHGICSRRAVTVIVTDECPGGGPCGGGNTHFDLSGAAFSRMAVAGAGAHLRDRGQLKVIYRSVCAHQDGVQVRREEHRLPCERGVDELLALGARRVRGRRGRHWLHAAEAGE